MTRDALLATLAAVKADVVAAHREALKKRARSALGLKEGAFVHDAHLAPDKLVDFQITVKNGEHLTLRLSAAALPVLARYLGDADVSKILEVV